MNAISENAVTRQALPVAQPNITETHPCYTADIFRLNSHIYDLPYIELA